MTRRSVIYGLWALVAGCAASGVSPPEGPPPSDPSSATVLREVTPYVFGHERLVGQVSVFGIPAADATVSVDGGCGDQAEPVTIRTSARSTGLFALFARSWLDMDTTLLPSLDLPIKSHSEIELLEKHRKYTVDYAPGAYSYEYVHDDGPPIREVVPLPGGSRAHDLHTAVLLLRSWRPVPGAKTDFFAVMGRRLWQIEVSFAGPDVAVIGGAPRPAVLIEGTARRIADEPRLRKQRDFRLWFSDDSERIPLRALAESEFGTVQIEANGYACPGCGSVCRVASGKDKHLGG
jgi:hypothetical protein